MLLPRSSATSITQGRLGRADTVRVVQSMVESWCDINRYGMCDGADGGIAEQIVCDMDVPLKHVVCVIPKLLLDACVGLHESWPGSYVLDLCDAVEVPDEELERAGLMLAHQEGDEDEYEAYDEQEIVE